MEGLRRRIVTLLYAFVIGTVSASLVPLSYAQAAGAASGGGAAGIQSSLCGIINTIASVIGILAIFMFVLGGILYGAAHLLPAAGNLKGSTQGWGVGMLVGGVIAIVLYLLSSFIIYRLASFSAGGPLPAISQVSCTGTFLAGIVGSGTPASGTGTSLAKIQSAASLLPSGSAAAYGGGAPGGSTAGGIVDYSNAYCKANTANVMIPNGNFASGYSRWSATGSGFGAGPTDLYVANENAGYYKMPWANYNGEFFATTYKQNAAYSPGNLTSDSFKVTEPFLNFKISSAQSAGLYMEMLLNGAPFIILHYNTTNGKGSYPLGTFANASVNLSPLFCQNVSVRFVSDVSGNSTNQDQFIAVTDFYLSNQSIATPGALLNSTII